MADQRRPTVVYEGLDFGEGPRWHDGRLWLSDFYRHEVISLGADGAKRTELTIDDQPRGLGWLPDGELLVVAMKSRRVLRVGLDGEVRTHADLSEVAIGDCNDMVVDGRGYAYVGNFGQPADGTGGRRGEADLAVVTPNGGVAVAARGLRFPNGSVITPDRRTLIVGESIGRRYTAFTVGDDGSLMDRRVWAELGDKLPDGCALDADGAIWMADAGGGGCFRVAEGGRILDRIEASQPVFACALGGSERRDLYLVTAPGFGGEAAAGTGRGRVEVVTVDAPGVGWP